MIYQLDSWIHGIWNCFMRFIYQPPWRRARPRPGPRPQLPWPDMAHQASQWAMSETTRATRHILCCEVTLIVFFNIPIYPHLIWNAYIYIYIHTHLYMLVYPQISPSNMCKYILSPLTLPISIWHYSIKQIKHIPMFGYHVKHVFLAMWTYLQPPAPGVGVSASARRRRPGTRADLQDMTGM